MYGGVIVINYGFYGFIFGVNWYWFWDFKCGRLVFIV